MHPHVFGDVLGRYLTFRQYQVEQTARGADVRIIASTEIDGSREIGSCILGTASSLCSMR